MTLDIASTELLDVCEQFAQVTLPDAIEEAGFGDLKNVKAAQDALESARLMLMAAFSGRSDVEPLPPPPGAPSGRSDHRIRELRDGSHMVASKSTPGAFYRVADFHCTCPAGRQGMRCWHVRVVEAHVRPPRRETNPTNKEWFT
jgi:hypothetical protein